MAASTNSYPRKKRLRGTWVEVVARHPWWLAGSEALSHRAQEAIADEANSVSVSAASARGSLLIKVLTSYQSRFIMLGRREMDIQHKDPLDRLLVAQAQWEDMVLVSSESLFDAFAVNRLW